MDIHIPTTTQDPPVRDTTVPPPASTAPQRDDLGDRPNVEVTQGAARGVRTAQGMGWFSIGLGLAQIVAPRAVGRLIGVNHGDGGVMRLIGVRALVTGLGLLSQRRASWWTGARIAGDVMDLALIGRELLRPGNDRGRLAATTVAVLGAAAADVHATRVLAGDIGLEEQVAQVTHVGKAITIDASAHTLYDFWRNLRNLPQIMDHLRSVEPIDATRSRWIANGPKNTTVRWDSEIVEDEPGELIAWRTLDGPFESSGSVRFLDAPGGRGTEVVVDMHYRVRGGIAGKLIAMLAGREPGLEVARGLRVLKQLFELGEPMRSDASIHRGMHAARPPSAAERADLVDELPTPRGAL